MKCNICKSDFIQPIQCFDNELYCPACLKRLAAGDFRLTPENVYLYTQSEKEFAEKRYAKAVDLCRQSALQRNPYAAVNMGFYTEYGYITSVDEADRVRAAFRWYDSVAVFHPKYRALRAVSADAQEYAPDAELSATAARNVMCLLINNRAHAEALRSSFQNQALNAIIASLAAIFGISEENIKERLESDLPADKARSASVFEDLLATGAVFGCVAAGAQALKQFLSDSEAVKLLFKRVDLWVFRANGSTRVQSFNALAGWTEYAEAEGRLTLVFWRRNAPRTLKYRNGNVNVRVRLNPAVFAERVDNSRIENTVLLDFASRGNNLLVTADDIVVAKENKNTGLLGLVAK